MPAPMRPKDGIKSKQINAKNKPRYNKNKAYFFICPNPISTLMSKTVARVPRYPAANKKRNTLLVA